MTEKNRTYRIIVSGGGTGGHIYPAVAVAHALKEELQPCEILFVGARGKMEMQKVPAAGFNIIGLPIAGLQRKLTARNLLFPFRLIYSLYKAYGILKDFKPDAAVGFGGYASGPLLFMATLKNLPTVIQEQNSYAGITNKLLGKRVDKICVSYENMQRFFPEEKIVVTGNPVRKSIADQKADRDKAFSQFGMETDRPVLLVLGGSLGARTINESILTNLDQIRESGCQLLWQCGKKYFKDLLERAGDKLGNGLVLTEFISEMDMAYSVADVVISRAGALSISELCLAGKPVVFVPSPNVAEDHQTKNALALVNKNAAVLIADAEASEELVSASISLLEDHEKRSELSENIRKLARPDAVKDIVKEVVQLVNK